MRNVKRHRGFGGGCGLALPVAAGFGAGGIAGRRDDGA